MHIPDGYLDVPTCAVAFGVMIPIWYTAGKKLSRTLHSRQVPLLAFGAAFSFVLMMFNFPVVGGSSGHAVGGALLAILLGPWAAVSVLSVVIAIQALLFHDGGITTFGANAFTMAFVLPFVSYFVYRVFAGRNDPVFRKSLAGCLAGYLGLAAAALVTGILLGIQPHGTAGYCPYPLSVTVPAMLGSHLLVFGWVEGLVTGLVLAWVYKSYASGIPAFEGSTGSRPIWIAMFVLILLSPLGLLANETAFGEWGESELARLLGYVPAGIRRFSRIWTTPLAGYHLEGHSLVYGYIASAIIGCVAAGLFALALGKTLTREKETENASPLPAAQTPDQLPSWLLRKEELADAPQAPSRVPLSNMLHRVGDFFSHVFCLEEFQRGDGFLQKRDPRIKIFTFGLFIFLSAWLKNPLLLAALLVLAFALAGFSRIPFPWFFQSVFLTMAAFSLIIALPAAFAWITPGHPLLALYTPYLVITREGAIGAGIFILRTTAAVSCSALLTLTTPWTKLLKALQVFRVPKIFLFVVEMAYRYIFLFVRLLEQVGFARRSRIIAPLTLRLEQRWTAGRMAFLLQRSLELAESVYGAMVARGYDGTIRSLERFSFDGWDAALGGGALAVFALSVFLSARFGL